MNNTTAQVMGHRRRQNNLQQRVNSAKRKSNNELRNAISAMQLQFQVSHDFWTAKFVLLKFLKPIIGDVEQNVDRPQILIRALHATHLLRGQGPSTFTLNSKKEIFLFGGSGGAGSRGVIMLTMQQKDPPLMTKDSIFYIGTMEKAKNLLCWIKSSSLSGEIMKNYRFLSFV